MAPRDLLPLLAAFLVCAHLGTALGQCDPDEEAKALTLMKTFEMQYDLHQRRIQQAHWAWRTDYSQDNAKHAGQIEWDMTQQTALEADKLTVISIDKLCSPETEKRLNIYLDLQHSHNMKEIEPTLRALHDVVSVLGDAIDLVTKRYAERDKDIQIYTPNEALKMWIFWREETGKLRNNYTSLVELSQELLNKKGSKYADKGLEWLSAYDKEDPASFRRLVDGLLDQIMPLFRQIHVHYGQRLKRILPRETFSKLPLIPEHLSTGMYKEMLPYPNKLAHDITPELIRQNYTAMRMFRMADEFFISLGLKEATQDFWDKSMFVDPKEKNREVDCQAMAWDFYDGHDYRVKMCTKINQDDFVTIHHELGHIQNYMQYAHLPPAYRQDANPAFGEALGDALALSVSSSKHLKAVGLMDQDAVEDDETDLNFLLMKALEKITYLPDTYIEDRFRWDSFSGVTSPHNYTKHYWDLQCKYQGRIPPVERTEEHLDSATYRRMVTNTPVIQYFVSTAIEFQIYEALCNATNHVGPLHKCDFYNNKQAGRKLGDMLKLGSSKPWPEVLEGLTGSRQLTFDSMLRYFAPLKEYLDNTVGEVPDWEDECKRTVPGLVSST